jgi:glycosyltransferase involved in cell wall biosynthesis
MGIKLISHVNGDSDLIEAWIRYYVLLGIDRFHLIVHGSQEENSKLFEIKDSYPITIEDHYTGTFHIDEKKRRLDAVLAQFTRQWVMLLDSDEFVEFPYANIVETIRQLESKSANLMAAPMVQHITVDGSLESPFTIVDPFQRFPLCSVDLYRRMGVKGDIFKFPLFYCADNTRVAEGGNHHPPRGGEPRATFLSGVTHHFKFRRTVSRRLDSRIHSDHPWRHESVQFRSYLEGHSNKLPLEGSFVYSREELFRRRLLRKLPDSALTASISPTQLFGNGHNIAKCEIESIAEKKDKIDAAPAPRTSGPGLLFVLPTATDTDGCEEHLSMLLCALNGAVRPEIVCSHQDGMTCCLDQGSRTGTTIKCVKQPLSFVDWYRLIRGSRPEIVVFYHNLPTAFSIQAMAASVVTRVKRRISIHCAMAPSLTPTRQENSPRKRVRRAVGHLNRNRVKVKVAGYIAHKTICISKAVRDSLVRGYELSDRKTLMIYSGVSTSKFSPCENARSALRDKYGAGKEEFILICATKLSEEKRIDILIHAVSRVNRQGVACKCIIIGDGPFKKELQKEANSLGLTGYIFFEDAQKDVRMYLQGGSAFIPSSRNDSSQLSVLKAMACGLPCIVTDASGNAELVTDHVTGFVISAESLDETEAAILYMATHPHECSEMGGNARELVCRSFDIRDRSEELKAAILY